MISVRAHTVAFLTTFLSVLRLLSVFSLNQYNPCSIFQIELDGMWILLHELCQQFPQTIWGIATQEHVLAQMNNEKQAHLSKPITY